VSDARPLPRGRRPARTLRSAACMSSSSASSSACASSGFSWCSRRERGGGREEGRATTGLGQSSRHSSRCSASAPSPSAGTCRQQMDSVLAVRCAVAAAQEARGVAAGRERARRGGTATTRLQLLGPLRVCLQRRPERGRVDCAAVLVQVERRVRHGGRRRHSKVASPRWHPCAPSRGTKGPAHVAAAPAGHNTALPGGAPATSKAQACRPAGHSPFPRGQPRPGLRAGSCIQQHRGAQCVCVCVSCFAAK
jgi:hypothetical protein